MTTAENTLPAASAKPARRKRGARFWIVTSASVLIGLPLLLYAGVWAYINFGFLNNTIEQRLSRKLGTQAHVDSVKSDVLSSLKINTISIEPRWPSAPLTVGSTKIDFGLFELLADNHNHIRAVTIDRPRLDLQYDPARGWNHALKVSTKPNEPIQIDRINLNDGAFSVEWAPEQKFELTKISGTFTTEGDSTPFSLRGALDSSEVLSIEGLVGPGRAFTVHAAGKLILNRDVPPALGLSGALRAEFSAKREAEGSEAAPDNGTLQSPSRDAVGVDTKLSVRDFQWAIPQSPGQRIVVPSEDIGIHANVEPSAAESGAIEVSGLKVDLGALGMISASATVNRKPPMSASINGASGKVDLGALFWLCKPSPLGSDVVLKAVLDFSNANFSLPLEEGGAPQRAEAQLATHGALISLYGGEPISIDGTAALAWPALKNGALKIGSATSLEFEISDLTKTAGVVALTETARILRAQFNIQDVYAPVGGAIDGGPVRLQWLTPYSADGVSKLRISGLDVKGISVDKWLPLLPAPEWKLSGPIAAELEFERGVLKGILLSGELSGKSVKSGLSASGSVRWKLERDARGALDTTEFVADSVSIPLNAAGHLAGWLETAGIAVNGVLKGSDVRYDSATHAMTGRVRLESGGTDCPITTRERLIAADVLSVFSYDYTAMMLRNLNVCDMARMKGVKADVMFSMTRERFQISGNVEPFKIAVKVPLWDMEVATVPASTFTFDARDNVGTTMANAELNWGAGKITAQASSVPGSENWSYGAALIDGAANCLTLSGGADLKKCETNLEAAINAVPLAKLGAGAAKNAGGGPWSGELRDLHLSVAPFCYALDKLPKINAHAKGTFVNAAFACKTHAFAQLNGNFDVYTSIDNESCNVVATTQLASYAGQLFGGAYMIPPAGTRAPMSEIKLVAVLPLAARPFGSTANIESIEVKLAGLGEFSAGGSVAFSGSELSTLNLRNIEWKISNWPPAISVPAHPMNRELSTDQSGEIKLYGSVRLAGAMIWERERGFALDGGVELANASLRVGSATPFRVNGVNGTIPISLRQGDGSVRDGGPRAKVKFEAANYGLLAACKQELEIEALSNGFTIHTPLDFSDNGVLVSLGPVRLDELMPPIFAAPIVDVKQTDAPHSWFPNLAPQKATMTSGTHAPRCSFRMSVLLNIDQILRRNGVVVKGLSDCILSGAPIECALVRSDGPRGPWELITGATPECKGDAILTAPLYGGLLVAKDFNAHGIFGPTPAFGGTVLAVGKNWPEKNGGINVQEFVKHYPEFGHFNVRMTGTLSNFETTSLELSGIKNFTLDLDSVRGGKNEFWYDGALAMALNYALVRNSFPGMFSDEYIRGLTFGIDKLSMQFILRDGVLYGPRPKLQNNLLLRGYGAEGNPFASRYKKDIEGTNDYQKNWAEAVKWVKEKFR
ncbi:MAG TPA: hypothetical protein VKX17_10665 [Planctomycetota bacterium]|nr:hypothetical protein [Planctomycetota bacterium]